MLKIESVGQAIAATDYWESEWNTRGLVAVSLNAGAFRILLPDNMIDQVGDMQTAREVVVSKGPCRGKLAYEVLFDDHTDNPYSLILDARQFASLQPADGEHGKDVRVSVWTRGPQRVLDMPARFRVVQRLPCLQPWK